MQTRFARQQIILPLLALLLGTAWSRANDFTDPNTHNPGITPGTVLSFSGESGQSITLTAVQGDRESLYPNQSTTLPISADSTYNSQALVAYTYSSTAHAEDYEGYGIDSSTAAGDGTIYEISPGEGRVPAEWSNLQKYRNASKTFTGFYQYEVVTSEYGVKSVSSTIEGPLPAGSVLDALLNGASATPDFTQPLDFLLTDNGSTGSWVERAQVIINEIDATVSSGTYKYIRYVATWQYAGSNNVGQYLYGIYVPVSNKLYFAGDARAILVDPSGNIVSPNNANGFYEIDGVTASSLGVSGTWPTGNKTGEAAQPGFYMSATSPQIAPLFTPTGTIASPEMVRQGATVAVTFAISSST